jgi:hypothetical protein
MYLYGGIMKLNLLNLVLIAQLTSFALSLPVRAEGSVDVTPETIKANQSAMSVKIDAFETKANAEKAKAETDISEGTSTNNEMLLNMGQEEEGAANIKLEDVPLLRALNTEQGTGLIDKCYKAYETSQGASLAAMAPTQKLMNDKDAASGKDKGPGVSEMATTAAANFKSASSAFDLAYGACKAIMPTCTKNVAHSADGKVLEGEINKSCISEQKGVVAKITLEKSQRQGLADSAGHTMHMIKVGAVVGGAAIVGGILYKDHKDHKKAEEKKEKVEDDFQNGIAKNADGTTTNCLTTTTYKNAECQPVMLNYCAKTDNAGKAGCTAFNNAYCSAADATQAYCASTAAQEYCKQEGDVIGQSPACQWMSARPSSCARTPQDVKCLTAMSPAQLDAECPKFPNDPLCKAYKSGKVVTQPGNTTDVTLRPVMGGTPEASGLNGLVNSQTLSSTTETASVWHTNSAAYRTLCAKGELINCK